MNRRHLFIVFTLAATLVGLPSAWQTIAKEKEEEGEKFASRFWNFLQKAEYEHWAPYPGQDLGFVEGRAPHGAFLKLFVNRQAAAKPEDPPPGSIIIKENYGEDKNALMAITVMYRLEKKYDPEHNNWWWVKYTPEGKVTTMGDKRLAGKVQGCIDCHSGAKGNDMVFTNDSGANNSDAD